LWGIKIFGNTLKKIILTYVSGCDLKVYSCERDIEEKGGYLAVLYTDMPLVTLSSIYSAINAMFTEESGYIGIGNGYIKDLSHPDRKQKTTIFSQEFVSVTDASSLNMVYNVLKQRSVNECTSKGVMVFGFPEIDFTSTVEGGATLEDGCKIKGKTFICKDAKICFGSEITDSIVGSNCVIKNSVLENCRIGEKTTVGSFAYIRQNSVIGSGCRIGDFVEIKNSTLGDGVKAAHLAYIGDATVGDRVNVGCGTVFCNYNGKIKQHTNVGNDVFIGANVNLIAPLSLGDGCYVAAGSTVTDEVLEKELCIARARQINKQKKYPSQYGLYGAGTLGGQA
jgi:UDP-N-acetylglucosamine diphosphorylase/glucosamine-1-phosphate N-acetyltransferase